MPAANESPSSDWSIEDLTAFTQKQARRIRLAPQRMALDVFRMGSALVIIKDKLTAEGEYGAWLKKEKIPRTTAHHATKLFTHYKTEDKLDGKKISEAKRECGLMKAKPARPNLPTWTAKAPRPVVRLVTGIETFRGALDGLDGMDNDTRASLAEALAELSRLVTGLNGEDKPKAPAAAHTKKAKAAAVAAD